ncbi:MAG: hypothetical protein ACREON_20000 [Gemmatimonadaceae bacterium]
MLANIDRTVLLVMLLIGFGLLVGYGMRVDKEREDREEREQRERREEANAQAPQFLASVRTSG